MSSDRIHGTHAREGLDKAVLFFAFAIGAVGTIWLKLVEVPVLVVAIFPVAVLLAYVFACLRLRDIGTEPETIGDNSYYLGFLFTLASLAVTLYRIRDIGADDADLIPTVISGFGVALSSTIGGVFLRVFLLQLRPDIVARDRAARRDLATGARELREAMAHASRVLKDVSVETQQHVAERNNKMSRLLEIQAQESSKQLERQSKVLETQAQEGSKQLERQAEAYDQIIRDFGQKLTEEVGGVLRKEAKASAEELHAATKTFREGLDAIGASRAKADVDLQSNIESFREVVNQIKSITTEHSKATEGSYRTLAARSAKVAQSLSSASDTVDRAVAQARRVVEDAQVSAEASRASARQEEQNLAEHAESVARALQQLEVALTDRTQAIVKLPLTVPAPAVVQQPYSPPAEPSTPTSAPTVGIAAPEPEATAEQTPAFTNQVRG